LPRSTKTPPAPTTPPLAGARFTSTPLATTTPLISGAATALLGAQDALREAERQLSEETRKRSRA
jgi:hypothetical protein